MGTDPDRKALGTDPAKWFRFDRIRIRNTDKNLSVLWQVHSPFSERQAPEMISVAATPKNKEPYSELLFNFINDRLKTSILYSLLSHLVICLVVKR
jgi:hypothetical protein